MTTITNDDTGIATGQTVTDFALLSRSQQNFTTGQLFTGALGAGTGILRSDAQVELHGTTALLSLVQTTNPGTATNESAYTWGAYDASGNLKKTASASSKWASANATTGYGVLRLNSVYNGGASDDVAIRIFGGNGVALWANGDTINDAPGDQIFRVNGTARSEFYQAGTTISGNFKRALDVRNVAQTYGVLIGHDSVAGSGIIAPVGGGPLIFWAFDGAAWAERVRISEKGSLIVGTAALATTATDGFLYVPSCAGAATGTPTAFTGRVPHVVDTTNGKAWWYYGGAWHFAALT